MWYKKILYWKISNPTVNFYHFLGRCKFDRSFFFFIGMMKITSAGLKCIHQRKREILSFLFISLVILYVIIVECYLILFINRLIIYLALRWAALFHVLVFFLIFLYFLTYFLYIHHCICVTIVYKLTKFNNKLLINNFKFKNTIKY